MKYIPCGIYMVLASEDYFYEIMQPCNCWSCPFCRNVKTKDICRILQLIIKEYKLKTVYRRQITVKNPSKWLQRNVKGWYFWVRTEAGIGVISNSWFKGSRRKGVRETISLVRLTLLKPPKAKGENRYDYSAELAKYFKKETSPWVLVSIWREDLFKEWRSLKFSRERALWMLHHHGKGAKPTKKGWKFIEAQLDIETIRTSGIILEGSEDLDIYLEGQARPQKEGHDDHPHPTDTESV